MIFKSKAIIIMILLIVSQSLFAGRYAGDFMAIGSGVRALGLGGAFSAIADDGSAIYWNASGISQIKEREVILMRAFLYEGLAYYDNFTFCLPLPNDVTIGFNWIRLTIDNIPIFDERHLIGTNIDQRAAFEELQLSAIPDGSFKSTDDMYQFAFARHFSHLFDLGWNLFELPVDMYFGGVFKYINRQMYGFSANGFGFDLSLMMQTDFGMLLDVEWMGDLAWSLNFQDIGNSGITWNTESRNVDEVLFNTKLGIAYFQPINRYQSDLILSYSKDFVYDMTDYFGIGWKYRDMTEFRLGMYDKNFSAGVGLSLFDFTIDYAFLTNNLGNSNRIGLGYRF